MRAAIFALLAACAPSGAVDPWAACEDPADCGEGPRAPAHVSRMGDDVTGWATSDDTGTTGGSSSSTSGDTGGASPTTGTTGEAGTGGLPPSLLTTGEDATTGEGSTGSPDDTGDVPEGSTGAEVQPPQPEAGPYAECFACDDPDDPKTCKEFDVCGPGADCFWLIKDSAMYGPMIGGFCSATCEADADCPAVPGASAVPACVNKGAYVALDLPSRCALVCETAADCPAGMACELLIAPADLGAPRVCW